MNKILFIVTICVVLFTGCSTKIEVDRKVGQLNLESAKLKQEKPVDNVIAIVSPSISLPKKENKNQQIQQFPLGFYQPTRTSTQFDADNTFSSNYKDRLNQALESSITEILSAKGFKLKGPYSHLEDMTYQDKKQVYLAFVPKIDFRIDNKSTKTIPERLYTRTEGVIQISGSFTISIQEPITGQVFLNRRINLSDFNISEPYIYEVQHSTGDGTITGAAFDKATAPDLITDTTDVALTKAINQFYSKAIERINSFIDREEILSFEKDINQLKDLKRY
ncbi:HpaA family protein [Aliarcobacter skirrowii]|uniref:HpaA family protein n=1 Tax=Aliarcobacter skirrowii TaxID=28200 RepID=UPI00082E2E54|nr:HpaA family protein [Aliarcobacter skirrowii]